MILHTNVIVRSFANIGMSLHRSSTIFDIPKEVIRDANRIRMIMTRKLPFHNYTSWTWTHPRWQLLIFHPARPPFCKPTYYILVARKSQKQGDKHRCLRSNLLKFCTTWIFPKPQSPIECCKTNSGSHNRSDYWMQL